MSISCSLVSSVLLTGVAFFVSALSLAAHGSACLVCRVQVNRFQSSLGKFNPRDTGEQARARFGHSQHQSLIKLIAATVAWQQQVSTDRLTPQKQRSQLVLNLWYRVNQYARSRWARFSLAAVEPPKNHELNVSEQLNLICLARPIYQNLNAVAKIIICDRACLGIIQSGYRLHHVSFHLFVPSPPFVCLRSIFSSSWVVITSTIPTSIFDWYFDWHRSTDTVRLIL